MGLLDERSVACLLQTSTESRLILCGSFPTKLRLDARLDVRFGVPLPPCIALTIEVPSSDTIADVWAHVQVAVADRSELPQVWRTAALENGGPEVGLWKIFLDDQNIRQHDLPLSHFGLKNGSRS